MSEGGKDSEQSRMLLNKQACGNNEIQNNEICKIRGIHRARHPFRTIDKIAASRELEHKP